MASSIRPKVLFIARFNSPASHRMEAHLIGRLHERGVEIEVLTGGPSIHTEFFDKAGIKVHFGHPESKISPGHIKNIRKLIIQGGFNILHLFNSRAISNGLWAARGLDVKVITYRGSGDLHWHDPFAYLTHLNPRVDRISCLSHFVKRQVDRQFLFRKKKTQVHYKAFLPEWFENINPAGLTQFDVPEGAFVATCAANYRKVKGLEYLLRATYHLSHLKNFHLLVIGRGMDRQNIQDIVRQSPMKDRIHFAGYREDIYQCVKASDIYIQPSLNEGLSRSVIEAMALEVPCVVSNIGGLPELIIDMKTGLLVPPKDPRALAKAIERLISNKTLRDSLGQNARKHLLENFSMDKYVDGIYTMYQDILK